MQFKFNIADKVLSNKLGSPSVYLVVGMIDGESYRDGLAETNNLGTADRWDAVYSGWDDTLVYFLKSATPQKSLSYPEYKEQRPNGTFEEYQSLPDQTIYALPEMDLVSLDNLFD